MTERFEVPIADDPGRVAAALTPEAVLDLCRAQLSAVEVGVRTAWRACRPVEALYHPGRYVRLAYALLSDPAIPAERYWPEGEIVYLHWPVRQPLSRRGSMLRLAGWDVEAYVFPNDRRLRSLRKFTGHATVTRLWQSWSRECPEAAAVSTDQLRRVLIRYVPEQKFVARIQARGLGDPSSESSDPSIAVRSSSPERCRALCARHRSVARMTPGVSKHLYVPNAMLVDGAPDIMVCEWVRGRSLLEKLETRDSTQVLRRLARTLRDFHGLRVDGLKTLQPRDLARQVEHACTDLRLTCPELAPRLTGLAAELGGRLESLQVEGPVTLHNDLHWNQVRIHQRRCAMLDLEQMCIGDPLVDVANFVTQVRMLGQRREREVDPAQAEQWAQEFLTHWESATGRPISVERLHLYASISLLGLARGMMRHLRPGWQELAQQCVEQAEAELNLIGRGAVVP